MGSRLVHAREVGAFSSASSSVIRARSGRPGDAVDFAVGHTERPADVAHGGLRAQRAEGDDLGDVVGAVLARDVRDHLVATAVLEVDVDVGHRHAVGVEEALEGQRVADG